MFRILEFGARNLGVVGLRMFRESGVVGFRI